jgi:hypothetical protein
MKKLSINEMEMLNGGLCIDRPGQGQENSGVICPGMCMASLIVLANTGHGLGSDSLICIA